MILYPFPLLIHVPVLWDLVLFAPLERQTYFGGCGGKEDCAEGIRWAGSESGDPEEAEAHCPPCLLVLLLPGSVLKGS